LGGGNEVDYNQVIKMDPSQGSPNFYDYKYGGNSITGAQFTPLRMKVFHYMLFGDQFLGQNNDTTSSGASYPGDDDTFVAYGDIKDVLTGLYSSFTTAVAGTIIHELGHTLCLTVYNNGNPKYDGQPASCRYAGVDSHAGTYYLSSMNYDDQLELVNYSDGANGSSDHDDWSAIRLFDFTTHENSQDPEQGINPAKKQKLKRVVTKAIEGPTRQQLLDIKLKLKLHK
jgi:hypothetical protein